MRFSANVLQMSLLQDLSSRIDVDAPTWAIDDSPEQVACYRLKESLLKKFNQADRPSPLCCRAALEKFLAVNDRMCKWELRLNTTAPDWELISMLRRELKSFLEPSDGAIYLDYYEMFNRGGVGPGASIGAKSCDFYTKIFTGPVSSTGPMSDVWTMMIARHHQFSRAFRPATEVGDVTVVGHNKLSFVNKNQDVARTICTEPTVNMWFQLGLGSILSSRLKRVYGIDFSRQQEVNRRMARLGSLLDHIATIDLESASDSLGLTMLHEIFPKRFMGMLMRLRSPYCKLPNGEVGS